MIHLYYFNTGNSMRAVLAAEECGLAYKKHPVDITKGEHKTPEFLKLNPAGMIPFMVDDSPAEGEKFSMAQSGAIVLYLAEKAGKLIPADPLQRYLALQWLFAVSTDINTPNRFLKFLEGKSDETAQAGKTVFTEFQQNNFRLIQSQIGNKEFVLDDFSIADVALYSITRLRISMIEETPGFDNLLKWYKRMSERPAVIKAYS